MPVEGSEGCLKSSAAFKDGSSREMISKELRGEELVLAHLLICVFLSSDLKEGKASLFCRDRRTEIANKIRRREDFFFSLSALKKGGTLFFSYHLEVDPTQMGL